MSLRSAPLVLALCALGGCSSGELLPVQRLDRTTAVHTTLMAEPWVYGRDAPMLAAHARDYLNLGVLQTNRAGKRADWLGVVAWSTVDRSALPGRPSLVQPGTLRLSWPGSSVELQPATGGRKAVGLSEPAFVDPDGVYTEAWYSLSAEHLSRLAEGPPVTVSLVDEEGRLSTYQAWRARPEVLATFLEETGARARGPEPHR